MKDTAHTTRILSVIFDTSRAEEQIKELKRRLDNGTPTKVFTPNTQMLLRAAANKDMSRLLNRADVNLPDGIGLCLAAKRLGIAFPARISGIDSAETILAYAAHKGYSVFLLGGKKGHAHRAARELVRKYPKLSIAGCHNGYFEKKGSDNERVLRLINGARPDILFVCFGFPEQEQWIYDNFRKIPSLRLAMGLGGSIDVWSGDAKRAPMLYRNMGLEWLWRAVKEPRRLRIFLDIPRFILLTEAQKRRSASNAERRNLC